MKSKKRVFLGILLIALVSVALWRGTLAFLSARRTTASNRFSMGTLDLNVTTNGSVAEPFVIDNLGENGNISGSKAWKVKNTGTLPGKLLVRLQNVVNKDNGCNDPERETETACDSDDDGELGAKVLLKVTLDGTELVSSTLATANEAKVGTDWNALSQIVLQPGEERTLGMNWAADENSYGNEVQSDSVTFDTNIRLIQNIAGPTPTN